MERMWFDTSSNWLRIDWGAIDVGIPLFLCDECLRQIFLHVVMMMTIMTDFLSDPDYNQPEDHHYSHYYDANPKVGILAAIVIVFVSPEVEVNGEIVAGVGVGGDH